MTVCETTSRDVETYLPRQPPTPGFVIPRTVANAALYALQESVFVRPDLEYGNAFRMIVAGLLSGELQELDAQAAHRTLLVMRGLGAVGVT